MLAARMQMAAAGVSAGGGGAFDDWSHYVEVTVQSSQVASNLTDFPVFVDLSTLPTGFFGEAKADGSDIRVTESDGETELPREVVAIDTVAETGELHFKAASVSSSVDTVFRLYVGNAGASEPAVSDPNGRNAVWADYAAVYHGDDLVDATGNGNTLTANGSAVAGNTGGKLGDAFSLPGAIGDYLEQAALSGITDSPATISAWFNPDVETGSGQGIVALEDMATASTADAWFRLTFQDNAASDPLRAQAQRAGGGNNLADTTAPTTAAWNFGVATADADGDVAVFLDGGGKVTEAASSVELSPIELLVIGRWYTNIEAVQPFDGLIDEVRCRAGVLADDWIAAEYTNQNTPGTFYTVGTLTAN